MVIKDRWPLTYGTLNSLYYSDEEKHGYDLFFVDNGSSPENFNNLKKWLSSGLLPFKGLVRLEKEIPIAEAWNIFLALSRGYDFRIKLDNDLVFLGTPAVSWSVLSSKNFGKPPTPSPGDVGTNPGSPKVAGFIKGIGDFGRRGRKKTQAVHSCFIQHLEECAIKSNAEVIALAPVPGNAPFPKIVQELAGQQYKGTSFLIGGCMMVTKKCFDQIGYFDERLPRRIDMEYSLRAVKSGFNIAYHDRYYVVDMGLQNTDSDAASKYQMATGILDKQGLKDYCSSKWSIVAPNIESALEENKIVNIQ